MRMHFTVPSAQGPIAIEVTADWKLAVENYCEACHLSWVHPALNSYSPLDKHYNIVAAKNMSGQGSYAYTLCDVAGTELPQFEISYQAPISLTRGPGKGCRSSLFLKIRDSASFPYALLSKDQNPHPDSHKWYQPSHEQYYPRPSMLPCRPLAHQRYPRNQP